MIAPGGDVSRGEAAASALYRHWCVGVRGYGTAEFTRFVTSPACRRAIGQQRAGVEAARSDRDGVVEGAQSHTDSDRTVPLLFGAVANLAIVIVAPALCRAIGQQRAGVLDSSGDGDGVTQV